MRVLVLGHRGLVGGAFVEELEAHGHEIAVLSEHGTVVPRRAVARFDLRRRGFGLGNLWRDNVDAVVLAAARVGGIGRNVAEGAEMLLDNLRIQNNVIEAAIAERIPKLLFLGSSCIYPRAGRDTVLDEDDLWGLDAYRHEVSYRHELHDDAVGRLEPSNRPYALAKLAGIELLLQYARAHDWFKPIVLMPPNLHGPVERDNYEPGQSHVLQALIARFAAASVWSPGKQPDVTLWGTGKPRREFMRVENIAEVGRMLLEREPECVVYNVGHGMDCSIQALASRVAGRVGFTGRILWDTSKPDGVLHKTMDSTRLRHELAWQPKKSMLDEIDQTIDEYLAAQGMTR